MISLCILLIAMGVAEALPVSDDNVPSSPVAAVEDSTPAPSASAAVEQGKGSKPNLYIFLGVIIPIVILSILVALGYLRRNRYAGDTEALSSDTSSTRTGKSGKSHKSWGRRSSLDSDSTSTRRKSVDSESGLSIIIPGRPRSDTTDTLPVYSPDSLPGYTREGDIGLASVSASASASTSSARSPPPSSSLSPSTAGVNNNVNISGGMPSGRSHFLSPPPPMRRSNEYGDLRIMDLYGATPIQVPEVPPYSVVERQSSGTPKSGL